MKNIYKARSIIERDALINELASEGIEATAEARDISRKVTDTTLDIAFEGYSAIIDGFAIFIPDESADKAQRIVKNYLENIRNKPSHFQKPYLQRFYMAAVFSVTLPVFLHAVGFYYLWKGIKKREPIKILSFVGSLLVFIPSGFEGWFIIVEILKKFHFT